jgi:hypothetical protein
VVYDHILWPIYLYIISDGYPCLSLQSGSQRRAQGPRHWTTHGRIATTKSWSFWRPHLGSIDMHQRTAWATGGKSLGQKMRNAMQCHGHPSSWFIIIPYHSWSIITVAIVACGSKAESWRCSSLPKTLPFDRLGFTALAAAQPAIDSLDWFAANVKVVA